MNSIDASSPGSTKSVEEFIDLGVTDDLTYSNFAIVAKCVNDESTLYAQDNVIYDYLKELKSSTVSVEFSDEDLIRYRYNPKKLSSDVYGTTELYFIILAVNGMCSLKDFNKKNIKMLYKKDVNELLTKIYNAEASFLSKNRDHVNNVEND